MAKQILQSLSEKTKTNEIRQFAQKYDWMCVTEAFIIFCIEDCIEDVIGMIFYKNRTQIKSNILDILGHFPSHIQIKKSKPRTMLFLIQ